MTLIQTLRWSGVWLRDRAQAGFRSLSRRQPASEARRWEWEEAAVENRLRRGPCDARNAIKLLALAGYPKTVTDLAEELANQSAARSAPPAATRPSTRSEGS